MGKRAVTPPNKTESISSKRAGNKMACENTKRTPESKLPTMLVFIFGAVALMCKAESVDITAAEPSKHTEITAAAAVTPIQPNMIPPIAGPAMRATCMVELDQAAPRDSFSRSRILGMAAYIVGCEKARATPVKKDATYSTS